MQSMIIHRPSANHNMDCDESELYVAETQTGTLITVTEYALKEAETQSPPELLCPCCLENHQETQPVVYRAEEHRFVHQNTCRDCFRDKRTNDRSHPLLTQTVYKQFRNHNQYSDAGIEYNLSRLGGNATLRYDIGAKLPQDEELSGIVVEVQHQSGRFTNRLYPRVRIAQKHNYGFCVVFSASARSQRWFRRRLVEMKSEDARVGTYRSGEVDLGTMILPDDNVTVLRTLSP